MSVTEAVQKGYLNSETVEKLAETGLQERPDIEIDWEAGTIQDKESKDIMSIDEAVTREYIDRDTADVLKLICGEWKETEVSSKQGGSTIIKKLTSDIRQEDEELQSRKTTTLSSPVNASTPRKKVKTLNEYMRSETFDSSSFIESIQTGSLNTDDSYLVNPQSGQVITLTEAIDTNVFDIKTGHVVNIETKERFSLDEAYIKGFIPPPGESITRTMQSGFVTNHFQYLDDQSDKHIHTAIQTNLKTSLTEPMEKPKGMPFREAVERGLVDEDAGTFCNPLNGEIMSIAMAIEYGWISESGETVIIEPERKYEKTIVVNQRAPSDELKRLSFSQALDQGFIDLGKSQYTEPTTGNRMSILDAIRGQHLETTCEEETFLTESMTLNSALESGAFDESTGLFTDNKSGQKLTLAEALTRGHIDGNSSMYDVESGKIYTLNEAIAKGKIDAVTGQYVENSSNKSSIKSAAKKGFIALIGAPYLAVKAVAGKKITLDDSVDMSTFKRKSKSKANDEKDISTMDEPVTIEATKFSVLGPTTLEVTQVRELTSVTAKDSDKMNFMEAVSSGYMNPDTGMFQSPDTGLYMNLQKAVQAGHIHPDSVKIKSNSGKFVNLQEALDEGVIDNTGHTVQDGEILNLEDMLQDGKLQETIPEVHAASSLVMKTTDKINVESVVDPRNNILCSLSMALDSGLINPHDGTYTNPKTGEMMNILEAVNFGYINGQVIDSITMKEGLSKEGFNAEVTFSEKKKVKVAAVLDTETGDKLSLHEAIRKGIIDESEGKFRDAKTGQSMAILDAMDHNYVTASEIDANMESTESYRKTSENTFTQTKSLDITTVIDPYTNEEISIPSAVERGILNIEAGVLKNTRTGTEMTISDAIKRGYVKGSQTSRKSGIFSDTLPKRYVHEKETVHLKSVYDQDQGRFIPVKQAIQKGIIDEKLGLYILEDGSTMTISRAIDERLIQVGDADSQGDELGFVQEKKSYTIQTVLDPLTGKRITPSQAIDKRLLNLSTGIFYNSVTREELTIPEAVNRGYVEANTTCNISPPLPVLKPTNVQVELGKKSFTVKAVLDPRTKEEMSVTEAVSQGVLDQSMCKYLDKRTGQTLSLRDAVHKGLVICEEVKDIPIKTDVFMESITVKSIIDPLSGKEYGLQKAVQKGLFDPDRGLVHNRLSDKMITLDDAVKLGLARVEQRSGVTEEEIVKGIIVEKVKDPMTGQDLDVKEAKRRGILDSDSGHYVDHKTHTKMSVEEALKTELIKGRKTDSIENIEKERKDRKQIVISQVLDTRTGAEVTVDEAVRKGLINKDLTCYTDPRTGKKFQIEEAMKKGLVSGTVSLTEASKTKISSPTTSITYDIISVTNTATGEKMTVTKAMKEGILAPSGMFVDTKSGRVIPVSDAIKEGLVDTKIQGDKKKRHKYDKFYKIVAPGKELHVITFTQALRNNFINGEDGTFTNPFDGKHMSVDEAILSDVLVSDSGKPFKFKSPKKDVASITFQHAFKSGLIDNHTGLFFDAKKGKSYEIEEALKKGNLCPLSASTGNSVGPVLQGEKEKDKPIQLLHTVVEHEAEFQPTFKEYNEAEKVVVIEQRSHSPVDEEAGMVDIATVTDTASGEKLSVTKAMKKGILAPSGMFVDTKSGRVMPVTDAIEEGFVETEKQGDKKKHKYDKFYKIVAPGTELHVITFTQALRNNFINSIEGTFINPFDGKHMSVDEAILSEVLVSDTGKAFKFKAPKRDRVSYTFQQAFKSGLLDPHTGLFWDVKKGKSYEIEEALKKGCLSPLTSSPGGDGGSVVIVKGGVLKPLITSQIVIEDEVAALPFEKDVTEHKKSLAAEETVDTVISTEENIDTVDTAVNKFFDQLTNGTEQIHYRISSPDAPNELILEQHSSMDESETDIPITVTEAITAGLVDWTTGEYIDPSTGDVLSVDEAVICGFLEMDRPEHTSNVQLVENLKSPISISEALADGSIDTDTGKFTCPSGDKISLQTAIQFGYVQAKLSDDDNDDADDEESEMDINPSKQPDDQFVTITVGSPFSPKHKEVFIDGKMISKSATEVVVSEGSTSYITRPGFFIDSTGKVVNSVTGERMSIQEAMLCGIADIEAAEGSGQVKLVGSHFVPPSLDVVEAESVVRITDICIQYSMSVVVKVKQTEII